MIHEHKFRIGSIPVLAVAQDESPERPVVLFYHGLHTSKETHEPELRSLAERGFVALGVDFQGHGERGVDISAYLKQAAWPEQAFRFLLPTLEEVPFLVDWLQIQGYRRFALAGISLGGLLAFGAPAVEPRLESVVSILGCPVWGALPGGRTPSGGGHYLRRSPHHRPESFDHVRLLAWNGGRDVHIPTPVTRDFMHGLDSDAEYREYPDSDHFMRPEDWRDGWEYSLDWLSRGFSGG